MFIRLIAILFLVIAHPLSLSVVAGDSDCGSSLTAMALDTQVSCCCGPEMASTCALSKVMSCGCFENSEPNAPAPTTPRSQTTQVIVLAAIMPATMTIESATASHPVLSDRSIGYFRSNNHKQATLCVWLS